MIIVRTAVLTREEAQVIKKASRLIDIAYPLASDPLVQRSTEALSRAVDPEHQHRTALRALQAYDLITRPRLSLAHHALSVLLEQVVVESEPTHWVALASHPNGDQAHQMAQVLAAERTGQQRLVRDALAVVEEALSHLGPDDDPVRLRRHHDEA